MLNIRIISLSAGTVDAVLSPVSLRDAATARGRGAEGIDIAVQVGKAVNNLILRACLVADHEGLAPTLRFDVDLRELRAADEQRGQPRPRQLGNQTMAWAKTI